MQRLRIPRLPIKSVATVSSVAATVGLLVCIDPVGGFDHAAGWALLGATVGGWLIVLGVHLRDSTVAEVRATRAEILAAVGRHDRRVSELIEAIDRYGEEHATAAAVAALGTQDRRNGTAPAGAAVRSIR